MSDTIIREARYRLRGPRRRLTVNCTHRSPKTSGSSPAHRRLPRPFARFGLIPVGGRSTAIKLRGGGVWVLASPLLGDVIKHSLPVVDPGPGFAVICDLRALSRCKKRTRFPEFPSGPQGVVGVSDAASVRCHAGAGVLERMKERHDFWERRPERHAHHARPGHHAEGGAPAPLRGGREAARRDGAHEPRLHRKVAHHAPLDEGRH
ncbi:hypothetical protein FIBSPDRAFT_901540 [Athelia psychrophila]|uniref:Uncharacterized protein n=1 Tax=Athelia psychrophila TaxID=1759441 RepID=A0A165X158_9AGAM|nr:hypothetical protein FIBSPDRAFT_901540 [Fibularhizoctonia sp. CBS 109695]